jgi:hypothetical protein
LPDWIDPETWAAFIEMRTAKNAKPTSYALKLILRDLETFREHGHDPNAILQESIKRNWTGVFKPKKSNASASPEADLLFTKQGQRNISVAQAYLEKMGRTCKAE